MRNKHQTLYHIDDETKKRILDVVSVKVDKVEFDNIVQYVARYEECVTPGMIASVPSQGNEQMAAGILQVTSSQLETILGESELYAEAGAGPLHPMMEGDDLDS